MTGAIALAWSEFPAATAAQLRWAFTYAHGGRRSTVTPPLLAVQPKDQRHVFGDLQIFGGDLDALARELGDFIDEMMRIEDDAIADDREFSGPHYASG